ncbi:methyltransferase, FkbM family [Dyadobacter soli]|uniref:Methyltransferase, FkbM family n=1 Tax=Dyadobacter soli TaxID=659014 RepID=A0A1G7YPR4_9BACT|nr:FkbM family methyltransferase [Dyadobacter soli]SDG98199.1 methyltransferase, FkbM family [Dyadobacter soli]
MPVTGPRRYVNLFRNVRNPFEYISDKLHDPGGTLHFTTKPYKLHFDVPASLHQVFKELFMADVYNIGALMRVLPADPLVIDIGANAGFFDILLLSKTKNAQIYAYEPLGSNIERMRSVASSNRRFDNSVIINSLAVTGTPCEMLRLYAQDTDDNQVVASSLKDFNTDNTRELLIPATSFSEIMAGMPKANVDLLKMDCEGSEYDIILNTPPDVVRRVERMLIEVHDIDSQFNINIFSQYLGELGYDVNYTSINGFCYALEACRK